jgi:hypothetical protein
MTELEFSINRSSVLSGCCVIIDSEELVGLSTEEKKDLIINYAEENGNWHQVESEEFVSYEVEEQ